MPEQLPGRRAPSQSAVPETLRGGTPNARVSLPPLLRLALRPPGRAEGVPVAGALARPSPPAEGNWTTQRDTETFLRRGRKELARQARQLESAGFSKQDKGTR